ncbi:hypothetical protein SAMN05421676_104180 [Salinibacillus kushneri]|uniref:YrhK-like protein n=1 Tax=Salinibacillus kushneri TaxID=237682 RepID=A0A1I0DUL8_9BACI|nr:hypothetical protein [Salinibacillus kushneri]SET36353.1 hypothetical protein SAMN05421676_104180 [Salinibacillus kushneri]
MKHLSILGKINATIGILFFTAGIIILVIDVNQDTFLLHQSMGIAYLCLGISIFLSGSFFKKKSRHN